ncbi:hypothetical protein D8X55_02820 [Malacoplasma penetrans]|uniref:Uncharacterized protein n=1 Tax=Malacoplasma penetrans (strain HF-2) TaxID=272633 RepID=Q8EUZ9_MALP2|nr:hypothetical protein [Malacoplasma penetrans]RXY96727.1 hypothetical protein D8X55_02820 [Malacoplasma penetrans]BAC44562.1 hypothetical protein [Malacoplasma penetrans HF-2]
MKDTLIIIKCPSGFIFSQIAKKKIEETTKLKTLNYEVLMNPSFEQIKEINQYKKIYLITNIKNDELWKSKDWEKIDLNDFIQNPSKY